MFENNGIINDDLQYGFQDPISPVMEGITDLHNYIMLFAIIILFFVFSMIVQIMYYFWYKLYVDVDMSDPYWVEARLINLYGNRNSHSIPLELVWTILPSTILVAIAVPSFSLLYAMDEPLFPSYTNVKVVGHQWYWSYEFGEIVNYDEMMSKKWRSSRLFIRKLKAKLLSKIPLSEKRKYSNKLSSIFVDFSEPISRRLSIKQKLFAFKRDNAEAEKISRLVRDVVSEFKDSRNSKLYSVVKFDSYMLADAELKHGQSRLLEVDNYLILPTNETIVIIVTAVDVLHSWALPTHGVKVDAVPGRLSQVELYSRYRGKYHGQCSEICGVNHGFMPIGVKFVDKRDFISYYTDIALAERRKRFEELNIFEGSPVKKLALKPLRK